VGISLFHTVGDRDRLVDQTNTVFSALLDQLWRKMGGDPAINTVGDQQRDPVGWLKRMEAQKDVMRKSPLWPLYQDTVLPVWREWRKFWGDQSSWEEFKTSWETYAQWHDRVTKLQEHVAAEAKRLTGDPLRSPSVTAPPTTIWADAEQAAAGLAGGVVAGAGDVLKYSIYAVLGIGAVVAVASVASSLKSGRDPIEHYTQLYRGG